jgi:hypothetical protein
MGLSHLQDQSRRFDRLTQVKLGHFFIFFSIKLFQSNDSDHEFDGLTQVIFYVFFNIILQYRVG